jgi:hypothetical protein
MRAAELRAFRQSDYLRELYDDRIAGIVRPAVERLIDALVALPEDGSTASRLDCFERCVRALNDRGHDIDTITREVLCDRLYELGDLVGLDADTGYLDAWRDF